MPALLRCGAGSAGRYRVSLRVLHAKEEYAVQIGSHAVVFHSGADGKAVFGTDGAAVVLDQAPVVTTARPYEGDLCEHELWFVTEGLPGRDYRPEYEFEVTKL